MEQVDIHELLEEVCRSFAPEATKKNLLLLPEINLQAEKSKFSSDKKQLKRVFAHLIGNAIKYTQKGKINLGYTWHESFIQFYIKDTGIGISEEQKESFFNMHKKNELESVTKLTEHGLSCSKTIIEDLGGKIWIESELGQGTIVNFQIPDVSLEKNQNDHPKPKKEKVHVLIAEDDIHSLTFLKTLLSLEGIIVYEAVNGEKAIEMVERIQEIDLVLIDMRMPELDGFETTRIIKNIRPDLPVIAQTAYTMKEDIEKAHQAGCNDYITKPIKKQLLIEKIQKMV